jgi:hypothetical protein
MAQWSCWPTVGDSQHAIYFFNFQKLWTITYVSPYFFKILFLPPKKFPPNENSSFFLLLLLLPVLNSSRELMQLTRQLAEIWTRLEKRWNDVFRLRARKFWLKRIELKQSKRVSPYIILSKLRNAAQNVNHVVFICLFFLLFFSLRVVPSALAMVSFPSYRFCICSSMTDPENNEAFVIHQIIWRRKKKKVKYITQKSNYDTQ